MHVIAFAQRMEAIATPVIASVVRITAIATPDIAPVQRMKAIPTLAVTSAHCMARLTSLRSPSCSVFVSLPVRCRWLSALARAEKTPADLRKQTLAKRLWGTHIELAKHILDELLT